MKILFVGPMLPDAAEIVEIAEPVAFRLSAS